MTAKELPCPHCGQDMHIPARYNATNIAALEAELKAERMRGTISDPGGAWAELEQKLENAGNENARLRAVMRAVVDADYTGQGSANDYDSVIEALQEELREALAGGLDG